MPFPGTYNFNYYKGDTFQFIIYPKASDGTAFDMTPYMYHVSTNPNNVKFRIASSRGSSPVPTYSATLTSVVNDVDNIVTCTITSTQGANLSSATTYYYDLQITDGTVVYTLLTGTITVTDDIYGA